MGELDIHERDKYNVIHRYCGIDEDQAGYGRQLDLLLTDGSVFHKKWQELYKENNSFLEIGLGAGEIVKYLDKEGVEYCGVDISDWVVNELSKLGLNVKEMSSHTLSFDDNTFDVVQHLDGLEHIPVEWELDTLSESIRVCKKYVFHSNAMGDASLDSISVSNGFDAVHINIKNSQEWDEFYESNTNLGYKILHKEVDSSTYRIILEKVK
jgi:ubiquinone/menaquinone biosynthesis C-methylase UbiE